MNLERKLQRVRNLLGKRKTAYAVPDNRVSLVMRKNHIGKLNRLAKLYKEQLKLTIEKNEAMVRTVREEEKKPENVVAVFDSTMTRALGMDEHAVNEQLVIVKVYYFGVAASIVKNGFMMGGKKYVFYSASAGQIRTKKFVAVREDDYEKIKMKLSCGLTVDAINAKGGVNTNKYLAYQALCSSASDPWPEFDIDKSIVVDDFETFVNDVVDFIDEKTYEVERKRMDVLIPHTDGCGMILPSVSRYNFMVRAPWVKGLLAVFPFDKFIREERRRGNKECGIIKDIYGVEHDVIAEGIEVIFTASQFKLYKYYDSWEQYKEYFKQYGCEACKCNVEEPFVEDARFNYQMLQTLTSITDEELGKIAERTNNTLKNVSSDRATMLRVFGATETNPHKSWFQKSLLVYPELLQDPYCRETLRDLRNSLEKYGKAGRLEIEGKYLFLIPDLYAACCFWFLGDKHPEGLLRNGEVYCRAYKDKDELDVLRSPHLYREHCVRKNTVKTNEEAKRWFISNGIYTSVFDTISKVLQFDVDGDKSLVVADPTIIGVAKRDTSGIVPLYYNMLKAPAAQVTPEILYNGMITAYTTGNIGAISNKITKIWNSDHPDIHAIKQLCCLNNFTIDTAKNLFKPEPPEEIEEHLNELTKQKLPHFFIYAKDKKPNQVLSVGGGCVDKLETIVRKGKFDFKKRQLGKFDYKLLMDDPDTIITADDKALIDKYYQLASTADGRVVVDETDGSNNYNEVFREIRNELLEIDQDVTHLVDVLVKQTFFVKKSKHKVVLWSCFGEEIYQNLCRNVPANTILCERCGKRVVKDGPHRVYCDECSAFMEREKYKNYKKRLKMSHLLKKACEPA